MGKILKMNSLAHLWTKLSHLEGWQKWKKKKTACRRFASTSERMMLRGHLFVRRMKIHFAWWAKVGETESTVVIIQVPSITQMTQGTCRSAQLVKFTRAHPTPASVNHLPLLHLFPPKVERSSTHSFILGGCSTFEKSMKEKWSWTPTSYKLASKYKKKGTRYLLKTMKLKHMKKTKN